MSYALRSWTSSPWWREPTKDQWYAFIAAWLGWTLDAFDFTVFLFLLVPIAREFHADLTLVVLVGSLTMWMRFVGAIAGGMVPPVLTYFAVEQHMGFAISMLIGTI